MDVTGRDHRRLPLRQMLRHYFRNIPFINHLRDRTRRTIRHRTVKMRATPICGAANMDRHVDRARCSDQCCMGVSKPQHFAGTGLHQLLPDHLRTEPPGTAQGQAAAL